MRRAVFTTGSVVAGVGSALLYYALRTQTPPRPGGRVPLRRLPTGRIYALAYSGAPGAPIVIALHGAGESIEDFRALTGYRLEQLAEQHRFTLVYGVGIGRTFNDGRHPLPYKARKRHVDDVAYLEDIVNDLAASPNDPVFGIGYSNGAHLLLRAVVESAGLFDGIAISGASQAEGAPPLPQAVSLVHLAGTRDRLSPISGGSPRLLGRILGPTIPVEATTQAFASTASAYRLERHQLKGRCPIDVTHWFGSGHEVWLYRAHGAGHTFPVPNARRARIYGQAPAIDFPLIALQHLAVVPGEENSSTLETGPRSYS